eukprot:8769635-Heterocapsa_arctica.AAC.1
MMSDAELVRVTIFRLIQSIGALGFTMSDAMCMLPMLVIVKVHVYTLPAVVTTSHELLAAL